MSIVKTNERHEIRQNSLTTCFYDGCVCLLIPTVEELLQSLEDPSNFRLRDFCQIEDFPKGTRHLALTTSNEDAASDDCFLRLATERILVNSDLEQMFGSVRDILRDTDAVAKRSNLFIRSQQGLRGFIVRGFILRATEIPALGRSPTNKGYICLELSAIQQWICAVPDTGRVVVVLVIICKCAPFRAGIDDAVAKDQSTGSADGIASRKIFDDVWRIFLALSAHQVQVQIFHPRLLCFQGYCSTERRSYGHDMRRGVRHSA